MHHEKFNYTSLESVREKAEEIGVKLPFSENISVLAEPITVSGLPIPNRLAIQPMEGCDASPDGFPSDLTLRRYLRFARSGAGLIWVEATAITPEGRANPRQLMLTEKSLESFRAMVKTIRKEALSFCGYEPAIILQLTHSGRYSKPEGVPAPIIAYNNPLFEGISPISPSHIITDDQLWELKERYGHCAALAEQAGFDGVDIKACHRYLTCELFSAYTRPGPFGGSFDNRVRFLSNAVEACKANTSERMIVTTRMNLYDGYPRPYGWGVGEKGVIPDMTEPIQLVKQLRDRYGVTLFNFTIGNPYSNPHINRPFDIGPYTPPEHPLEGLFRVCDVTSQVKKACSNITVVSSENTYLRQFSPYLAAGMVESGAADLAGFGRQAFAYPAFARDLLETGALKADHCCIACSKCTELMRANSVTGCVVRDREVYLPLYQKYVQKKPEKLAKI